MHIDSGDVRVVVCAFIAIIVSWRLPNRRDYATGVVFVALAYMAVTRGFAGSQGFVEANIISLVAAAVFISLAIPALFRIARSTIRAIRS